MAKINVPEQFWSWINSNADLLEHDLTDEQREGYLLACKDIFEKIEYE